MLLGSRPAHGGVRGESHAGQLLAAEVPSTAARPLNMVLLVIDTSFAARAQRQQPATGSGLPRSPCHFAHDIEAGLGSGLPPGRPARPVGMADLPQQIRQVASGPFATRGLDVMFPA